MFSAEILKWQINEIVSNVHECLSTMENSM